MLLNHFSFAIRNFKSHLVINSLNIIGLATGLAAFLILAYYISHETSFDKFHRNSEIIYRVESNFLPIETKNDKLATASFGYGPAMRDEMPEVNEYCRINLYQHEKDVKYGNRIYRENFVTPVDSNFFTFFTFPLIDGNPHEVLNKPLTMVISESASKKYFSNENPIGKMMEIKTIDNSENYTVTGIFKDFPEASHFKSDFLLSYPYASDWLNHTWYMHEAYLYLKVNSEANKNSIIEKFPMMSEKYKTSAALRDKKWEIELTPITDIHLNEPKAYELEGKGSRKSVYYLSMIAVLLMIIAWVNYINISTTYALERKGEISVRKCNGATFREILRQFLSEATVVNLLALFVSFILILLFLPAVQNKLIGNNLSGIWTSPILWIGSLIALGIGILLTGYAPSLLLSQVDSASILRNNSSFKRGNKKLREFLVIFQFITSIILIVGTLTVEKQISHMMGQDLGINIDQTLVFKTPTSTEGYNEKLNALSLEVEKIPGVKGITTSSMIPGKAVGNLLSNGRVDKYTDQNKLCEMLRVDYNFVDLYGLEILEGRNFEEGNEHDRDCLLLTETAANLFGFFDYKDAINKEILLEGVDKKFQIAGIIKDYHHISVKENYRPIVLFMAQEHGWIRNNYFSVKVTGSSVKAAVTKINEQYAQIFPEASFEYFFLDNFFQNQYQSDEKFGKLFMVFTWLGIFIVGLGILGLSGFILLKRTKEIGVRKVNGASSFKIVLLLSTDIIKWNLFAFVIATPIAYLLMRTWLENFPVKTTLSWWIFVLAGAMALGIALLTVSWQSWRAASRNPVEALRYE